MPNQQPGREYVQPQWIVDSMNFRILVDARLYAPGLIPPPHLSPFVDAEEEGYIPDYLATLRKMQASLLSGVYLYVLFNGSMEPYSHII